MGDGLSTKRKFVRVAMGGVQITKSLAAWHPCKYPVESKSAKMAHLVYKCSHQEEWCVSSLCFIGQEFARHVEIFLRGYDSNISQHVNRHFGTPPEIIVAWFKPILVPSEQMLHHKPSYSIIVISAQNTKSIFNSHCQILSLQNQVN